MELGEPEKKKETTRKRNERWARLDKSMERATAKQELARLVMVNFYSSI